MRDQTDIEDDGFQTMIPKPYAAKLHPPADADVDHPMIQTQTIFPTDSGAAGVAILLDGNTVTASGRDGWQVENSLRTQINHLDDALQKRLAYLGEAKPAQDNPSAILMRATMAGVIAAIHTLQMRLHGDEAAPVVQPDFVAEAMPLAAQILSSEAPTREDIHAAFVQKQKDEGWTLADHYSAEEQTSPFLVPFAALPPDQQLYRTVFFAAVQASARTQRMTL